MGFAWLRAKFARRLYRVVVPTQIRSMTSATTHDEQAEVLEQDLAEHPAVLDSDKDTSRRPHRVIVDVDALPIPAGVQDILEQHQASIEQVEGGNGGILLTLRPTQPWKPAGQRQVRSHGSSIVLTFTREALDVCELQDGDEVNLEARDGQLRITRRES